MTPSIKCFNFPMKLRKIKFQRVLTSLNAPEENSSTIEIFVSKIPPDADEDELIPFLEKIGPVHCLRLMMKTERTNRGCAYVTYLHETDAQNAISHLNGTMLRNGHPLFVARSFNNCRIFIGGIPTNKTKDDVWHELQKKGVPNIVDVILYRSYNNRSLNRGFAFVEFQSHIFAAKMRMKLQGLKLWNYEVLVDWSVPQPVFSEEEMAKVKIVYMRNLNVTDTRDDLATVIEKFINRANIEKVYKFKDYAFIHLSSRELALKLMEKLKDHYKNTIVEITLAKPRNFYTKPGYRKFQMSKTTPYVPRGNPYVTRSSPNVPKSFTNSSSSDLTTTSRSSPFNTSSDETCLNHGLVNGWNDYLPFPTTNSDAVYHWLKNGFNSYREQNSGYQFSMSSSIQNRLQNIQIGNQYTGLDNLNNMMDNLSLCGIDNSFFNFPDKLQMENRRY